MKVRDLFERLRWNGGAGGAAIRGGNWNNGANAGAFTLNLNNAATNTNTNIGFRCVFRPSVRLFEL